MTHTVCFNQELNIIETTFDGNIVIDDLYTILQKAVKLSLEHNCFLWLIDYRKAKINLNAFNMAHFIFAMRQATEPLGEKAQLIRRANVISETMGGHNFFISIEKSNLHNKRVKQFQTYHEALTWLYEAARTEEIPSPIVQRKQLITIQACINCNIKTVWEYWNSEEKISQWFRESDKWATSLIIHNLFENGTYHYRINSSDGKYGHFFSGKFKRIIPEKLIEYQLDDGRIQKAIFYPYGDQTIVTETIEADDVNIIDHQQKSWQDILDNFKNYVEKQSEKAPT